MTDNRTGHDQLARAATRLESYRRHCDTTGSGVLAGLAAELRQGGGSLMGTDLAVAYPAESLLSPSADSGLLVRTVELLRDVLLFAPVAFTWYRLSDALGAYRSSDSKDSFFTAWQNGIGDVPTLDATASDVTWIVLVVIALTALIHVVGRRADRRANLSDALTRDLASATLLVSVHTRAGDQTGVSVRTLNQIGTQIARSSDALQVGMSGAATAITQAMTTGPVAGLQTALDEWRRSTAQLAAVAQSLQAPQQTLDRITMLQTALGQQLQALGKRLESLVGELAEATSASREHAHSYSLVSDQVSAATSEVGTALTTLNDRAEVFGEIVDRLRYMIAALDGEGDRRWDGRAFDNVPPVER
ncbi:hypothetical protein [Streptomyces sp. NPDC086182]|uniref:hypothetical protein n=1 Tax=Streptomyces sp. NPDC086182 TaxID=3155058 RepID=UPI00344669BA